MFTGIIEETGTLESLSRGPQAWGLRVSARAALEGLAIGDSIAVNGCCLTAVAFDGSGITFDLVEETWRLANFRLLAPGSRVNLERSMRLGDRLGGHFVTGHVDGPGTVELLEARGAGHVLRVCGAPGTGRLLIPKGSVAVDGISLTVAEVQGDAFTAWIIPHTLTATNLGNRMTGDAVNLEYDMLGKYVEKLLQSRPS